MSEEDFYKIERYLLGNLTPEEEVSFEKELASNKELLIAAREYQ